MQNGYPESVPRLRAVFTGGYSEVEVSVEHTDHRQLVYSTRAFGPYTLDAMRASTRDLLQVHQNGPLGGGEVPVSTAQ